MSQRPEDAYSSLVTLLREFKDLTEENERATQLIGTMGTRLRDIVDLIRGKPPENCLWSTHDAVDLVRAVVLEHEGMQLLLRSNIELFKAIHESGEIPMDAMLKQAKSAMAKLDQVQDDRRTWKHPRE